MHVVQGTVTIPGTIAELFLVKLCLQAIENIIFSPLVCFQGDIKDIFLLLEC